VSVRYRRSGTSLILVGLAGVLFFWMTDRRYGWWSNASSIDQANQALAGTVIGIVGSLTVLGIGVWLLTRKPV
jgi:uncharacterized membrane protein